MPARTGSPLRRCLLLVLLTALAPVMALVISSDSPSKTFITHQHLPTELHQRQSCAHSSASEAADADVQLVDCPEPVKSANSEGPLLRCQDGLCLSIPLPTPWSHDVNISAPWPEYPRPQMARSDWLNLNGIWEFESSGAQGPALEGRPGQPLAKKILVPFPAEAPLSGANVADGGAVHMLYRRNFTVPSSWGSQRVLLHFGAVDWEAKVSVNGRPVGSHKGGYGKFHFDITDALTPSANTSPQELTVQVFDPTEAANIPIGKQRLNPPRSPSGIFYTASSGIWQTVWLEPVPPAHITSVLAKPSLANGLVTLHVSGSPAAHGKPFLATVSLPPASSPSSAANTATTHSPTSQNAPKTTQPNGKDRPGRPSQRPSTSNASLKPEQQQQQQAVNVVASACGIVGQPLDVAMGANGIRLWSPESPFLYDVDVVLVDESAMTHGGMCWEDGDVAKEEGTLGGLRGWMQGWRLAFGKREGDAPGSVTMQQAAPRENTTKVDAYANDAGTRVELQTSEHHNVADARAHAGNTRDPLKQQQQQGSVYESARNARAAAFVVAHRRRLLQQSSADELTELTSDSSGAVSGLKEALQRLISRARRAMPYLKDDSAPLAGAAESAAAELAQGDVRDSVRSYFGMRDVSLGPVGPGGHPRPLLNGEFVFQVGMLDQGFWPDGLYMAPTDEALASDLHLTKALGFNMLRKHIKVESDRWYYHADRLGILVWQDMPAWFAEKASAEEQEQFEAELTELIRQKSYSPAIINWVVFNEGWGQYDTERVVKLAMSLDDSRLFDCASGWNDAEVGNLIDMHNYVGPGSPHPTPTRAAVLGEFGGLGLRVEGHRWIPSQDFSYEMQPSSFALEVRYLGLVEALKNLMLSADYALSAAVYTELSDVEAEINGFVTYDRRVVKVEPYALPAAHRSLLELSRSLNTPRPDLP